MTKADIINEIATSTGIAKKDVSAVVESFMETIKDSLLEKKENVYLRVASSLSTVRKRQLVTSQRTRL